MKKDIREIIYNSVKSHYKDVAIEVNDIEIEYPRQRANGDLASNFPLKLSKKLNKKPIEVAQEIVADLKNQISNGALIVFSDVEIKGPGFINFWYSRKYLMDVLNEVIDKGNKYARQNTKKGRRINFEYVSANPTGPLTIAHGRQAVVGDVLIRILKHRGHDVTSEYYLNDDGNQINNLRESLRARYKQSCGIDCQLPEGGYKGQYVSDMALELKNQHGDSLLDKMEDTQTVVYFHEYALQKMVDLVFDDLKEFGIVFSEDEITSQKNQIMDTDRIDKTIADLKKKGFVFNEDDALWLKTTSFGDDKDRVLKKRDGSYTYFTPDIAYHAYKFERGFERCINIWGPDHHGYIPRMKAAIEMLGYSRESLEILIVQLATLFRAGQAVKMSTREGEYITLREVREEIGRDAARFFFLLRNTNSHLDFDIDLAKTKNLENPLYYIQYVHARISSILKNAEDNGFDKSNLSFSENRLIEKEELNIIKTFDRLSDVLDGCAIDLEPYRLITYLTGLASEFHSYYGKHKVVTDDKELSETRLYFVTAIKSVIALTLEKLLGVEAPETM